MLAVGFQVGDVVDQVDHARQHAEDYEAGDGAQQGGEIVEGQLAVEDHRREDDQVLGPLLRTHGLEDEKDGSDQLLHLPGIPDGGAQVTRKDSETSNPCQRVPNHSTNRVSQKGGGFSNLKIL